MLSLPPVSKAGRTDRISRRKRSVDAAQPEAAERRERVAAVQPAEERRKGGRGRRRDDQDQARAQSRPDRPFAPLVAQLIATSIGAPQTRPRRRATVQDAISAYEKAASPKPRNGGSNA